MPFSDDEYDSQSGFASETSNAQNLSKAELRKTNKPIMEKKRRARINHCLNELKDLLMDAMNKDPARHSKLEKADILELTVKHLQAQQRQQLAAAVAADPAVLRRFRAGFGDCATEVKRYLARHAPPTPPGLQSRLGCHLTTCLTGLERLAPREPPAFPDQRRADRHRPDTDIRVREFASERTARSDYRSAFHYVRRPASPPLSPLSCDSACDSSTEPETPPRALPLPSAAFPTPPSRSASDQDSSPETQRATVSSTTVSPDTRQQLEPLSIVIDVDNYKIKMAADASPMRPLVYKMADDAAPMRPLDYKMADDASPRRPFDYKMATDASPRRPLDYKMATEATPMRPHDYKMADDASPRRPIDYKMADDASPRRPLDYRHKLKRTAQCARSPGERASKAAKVEVGTEAAPQLAAVPRPAEADTSAADQRAHSSNDAMWRPW